MESKYHLYIIKSMIYLAHRNRKRTKTFIQFYRFLRTVFLTEFGFSEVNVPLQKQLEWLPQVYDVFEKAEYIEAVHYFRPFDDLGSTWGASTEKYFGLFNFARPLSCT